MKDQKQHIITFLVALLVSPTFVSAQSVGINTSGNAPDPSAMLDVSATDKGVLIPRVQLDDATNQAPIASAPVEGLLIYNETGSEPTGYYYWDGSQWVPITTGAKGINSSLTLSGNTLELTDPGGTLTEDLSSLVNDADADPSNELNTGLDLSNDSLILTDNGGTLKQDLSSLGGGAYWSRNSSKNFLYPTNAGDSIMVGHNARPGRIDVRYRMDDGGGSVTAGSAIYGKASQYNGDINLNMGVFGEAQGYSPSLQSSMSIGVLGMSHPDSNRFLTAGVYARLGSTSPEDWKSYGGAAALQADGNDIGAAAHFKDGAVGVGVADPDALFHVRNGNEADTTSNNNIEVGYIMAGKTTQSNIRIDDDEILAQYDGNTNPLYLQQPGGEVHIHEGMDEEHEVIVNDSGYVGVGTNSPSSHVHVDKSENGGDYAIEMTNLTETDLDANDMDGISWLNQNNNRWTAYMSATWLRWSYNGTYVAYIDPGNGSWNQASDRSLKENVSSVGGVLDKVMDLNVVNYEYEWNEEEQMGLIAQETVDLFPEFVSRDGPNSTYGMNYGGMSVIAIKAIQEQQKLIEEQREGLEQQKQRNDRLEERLEELEEKVEEGGD